MPHSRSHGKARSRPAPYTDTVPRQIEACEAHAYHLSQFIQPHGVFFAIDPATFRIIRLSANAASILHLATGALSGLDFRRLLTPASSTRLQELATKPHPARTSLTLAFESPASFVADAFLYPAGVFLCLEFEAAAANAAAAEAIEAPSSRFFDLIEGIIQAEVPSSALPGIVCQAIRDVTGVDRTYYCLFDQYDHGHVLGESRNDVLPDLLDHRFPATDIPQAARRMFVVNPYRLVPDVDAVPVPIQGGSGRALDLTMSTCRAVAPSHLQYIRNMGVQASFSFPVVREGRLEAIFGGHHATAHSLSFRQMATCRHLVELFKSRLDVLRMREKQATLAERIEAVYALSARYWAADRDLGAFIAANHDAFRALMDADDLICRFEGQIHIGRSLHKNDATRLLAFCATQRAGDAGTYQTDRIGHDNADFASLCPDVAGVCAISLDLQGENIIAWLRREVVVMEKWSGDPHGPAVVDSSGGVGPRTSFVAYQREVKGTSRLWPSVSDDLLRQLRHAFAQVLISHYEIGMRRAAEQSNALKSEFVANISHELRTPMHAIIGFADLLATAEADLPLVKRRRYAGVIQGSGKRLLRLINDLLDLSQLEAGKMTFTFSQGDILPTIETAIAEVDGLARDKSVKLVLRDHRPGCLGRFDANRIGQVIINLLSNALKFSPAGSEIVIDVDAVVTGPGGTRLVIEVSDQGPGIPDDELESVFEKFVQSSRAKSGAGGTGLGLAICRDIIEAHHGRIWAANNPAGGASLFIDIPLLPDLLESPDP